MSDAVVSAAVVVLVLLWVFDVGLVILIWRLNRLERALIRAAQTVANLRINASWPDADGAVGRPK